MKNLMMVLLICLAVPGALGRSFSIDLRQPAAKNGVRAMTQRRAAPSAADSGFLRRVNLDAGSADVGRVAVGDELSFTLFDDVTITLTLAKQMPSPLGGDVFIAAATGYGGIKNAVILRTADGLTVDMQDYLNKRVYKVISTATGVKVQELEAKAGKCGCDARVPANRAGKAPSRVRKAKKVGAAKNAESEVTCVDILVAYDENAAIWAVANGGGVTNFAQMAVQKMNTVLVNNGLDGYFRFRLVGIEEVPASSADLDYVLDAATDGTGDWASISAKRDEVGADIVTVLIDTGTDINTTGLGWSLETTDFESFADSAYNVCAIRSVAQSHTMTHEVGHNMGCGHSDVQETQPGPQLYHYSAGYYFSADGQNYHTIMAYDGEGPGGIEVPYFSSEMDYYHDVAVGDVNHDNRFTIYNTYEAVSKWRAEGGVDIGGDDEVPPEPLEWLTSRDEVFAKAKAEGKNVFLICGRDTCMNTMGTRNYSCEDPSVKRHLLKNYVCWYNVIDTQYEEAEKYFDGYDVGMTLPSIAIINVEKDETLEAEGGYHSVTDLRVMLGRVAKEVSFSPQSGSRFRDSVEVTLSAAPGSVIYYTLDGSDPSAGISILYDKPITLTSTATIRAITFENGAWGLPVDAVFSKSRTEKYGDYEWTADVVDDGCVIVSVTPTPVGEMTIPSKIEDMVVIGFDAEVFRRNKYLATLAIPGSIVEIPGYAFESCSKLRAVTIGDGVERIGAHAFAWTGLETVGIPASVTNIGVLAFTGCYGMTAVAVDSANEHYSSEGGLMYDKTLKHLLYCPGALRYAEIPQGVTRIGDCAFSDSNIERVVIPNTVTEIGESAFALCGQLKSIAIPESVTDIGYEAFSLCWGLTDAYLPKSLESYFSQDDVLETRFVGWEVGMHYYSGTLERIAVHFDANGGKIDNPNQALELVENTIVVPSALPVPTRTGCTFLGWFTAAGRGDEVTIDSVVTDGMTLYAHWEQIYYTYAYVDNADGTATLLQHDDHGHWIENPISPAPVGKFIVPGDVAGKRVVAIKEGFFSGCSEMTSVVIPSSVTNMTAYVFAHLDALEEIKVADDNPAYMDIDGVLYTKDGKTLVAYPCGRGGDVVIAQGTECIGEAAFFDNDNFDSVSFPVGLKVIEEDAFRSCAGWDNFTTMTIPSSVELIGAGAFCECANLETVIFEGDESLVTIDATAFFGTLYGAAKPFALVVDDHGELVGFDGVVPEELVIADYLNGQTLTGIGYRSLSGWTYDMGGLRSVVVPEGVTNIGQSAFAAASALESVTLPESLQRIDSGAFMYCVSLGEIRIPAGVTDVSGDVFYGCRRLGKVSAPSTLRDAFSIPDGCTVEYYEIPECTVTFNANDGTVAGEAIREIVVRYGMAVGKLPTLIWDNYTFGGWFTEPNAGNRVTEDTRITSNVTFYAHWIDTTGGDNSGGDNGGNTGANDGGNGDNAGANDGGNGDNAGANDGGNGDNAGANDGGNGDNSGANDGGNGDNSGANSGANDGGNGGNAGANAGVNDGNGGSDGGANPAVVPVADEPIYAGKINSGYFQVQTIIGALYSKDGSLEGTAQVKVGKVGKKGSVKLSAYATLMIDGKAKKVTAKAVNVMLDATGRVSPVKIAFKAPIGEMAFEMSADGTFTLKNGSYVMVAKKVGGDWTHSDAKVNMAAAGAVLPQGTIGELLPDGEPVIPKGGKWSFNKAVSVKYAKNKVTGEFELVIDESKGTNRSAMRLTYTPKTGLFKGTFRVYAIQDGKLKKFTVKVIGVVVDGKGEGSASGPNGLRFAVSVE